MLYHMLCPKKGRDITQHCTFIVLQYGKMAPMLKVYPFFGAEAFCMTNTGDFRRQPTTLRLNRCLHSLRTPFLCVALLSVS